MVNRSFDELKEKVVTVEREYASLLEISGDVPVIVVAGRKKLNDLAGALNELLAETEGIENLEDRNEARNEIVAISNAVNSSLLESEDF